MSLGEGNCDDSGFYVERADEEFGNNGSPNTWQP